MADATWSDGRSSEVAEIPQLKRPQLKRPQFNGHLTVPSAKASSTNSQQVGEQNITKLQHAVKDMLKNHGARLLADVDILCRQHMVEIPTGSQSETVSPESYETVSPKSYVNSSESAVKRASNRSRSSERSNRSARASNRSRLSSDEFEEAANYVERKKNRMLSVEAREQYGPSVSSFAGVNTTATDDMNFLRDMFQQSETHDIRKRESSWGRKHQFVTYSRQKLSRLDKEGFEMIYESLAAALIILNAVYFGVSAGLGGQGTTWDTVVGCIFTVLFAIELVNHVRRDGLRFYFLGPMWKWNIFDFLIVSIDLSYLVFASVGSFATLLRVLRLMRLARLLRLLKATIYWDLLAMISGIVGNMSTLGWAMLLHFTFIYVTALIFHESLMDYNDVIFKELFGTLWDSYYTVFRCSFGDCAASDGTPISMRLRRDVGGFACLVYGVLVFVTTIGVFNVISAIFVESTLAKANQMSQRSQQERLSDDSLYSTSMKQLFTFLLELIPEGRELLEGGNMSEYVEELYALEINNDIINTFVSIPEVIDVFKNLDIDPEDLRSLSDFLDPDNGGSMRPIDLVYGVRKLRGKPRRVDVMTVDLMLRTVQKDLAYMLMPLQQALTPSLLGGTFQGVEGGGND